MKPVVLVPLLFAALPAAAQTLDRNRDWVINQASELAPWCKSEAEARYIAKGITPYQWAASYHDASNVLYVDGRLRVHGDDVQVRCRIARGARERYGTIEIDDPSLNNQTDPQSPASEINSGS